MPTGGPSQRMLYNHMTKTVQVLGGDEATSGAGVLGGGDDASGAGVAAAAGPADELAPCC